MVFLQKLDWLMERDGLNKHTLAQQSGVPYTTIVGLYERGAENARLSTLNRLCAFFKVSLDYLAIDDYERPEDFVPNGNTASVVCETKDEAELISLYRGLNDTARSAVMVTVRGLAGNPDIQKEGSSGAAAI